MKEPKTSYLLSYTIALWTSYLAVSLGKPLSASGWTEEFPFRAVAMLVACMAGAAICLTLDWLLRGAKLRALAQSAGYAFLLAAGGAILWAAIARLLIVPLLRPAFDPAIMGGTKLAEDLAASTALFLFFSWVCAWLAVTYAEELRESRAETRAALSDVVELRQLLGPAASDRPSGWIDHLWVPTRYGSVRLPIDRLVSLRSEGDYVRLSAVDGASFLVRTALRQLEERLDPRCFRRIHRSSIVNLAHVVEIGREGARGAAVRLSDGSSIKVGKSFTAAVRTILTRV